MLILARPSTLREWLWLGGAALWAGLWLAQPGAGLPVYVVRAAAVLLTGAFLALTLHRPSGEVSRAVLATVVAGAALALWAAHFGIPWDEVRQGFERELWTSNSALADRMVEAGASQAETGLLADQLAAAARATATFLPALLAIAALAGLRLAWAWHHRIAAHPLGAPPSGFAGFRFSDQLVWALVVGLALAILPGDAGWRLAGTNLLVAVGLLYAVRGLAVFSAGSGRLPGAWVALLTFVAMFLLPIAVGGLTLLGLADTWLDFRRRGATPVT